MGHTIETDRLLLQPLNQSHFDFMLELEAITESYEYDRDTPLSPDEVKEGCHWFIEKVKSLPKEGAIRWIVIYNGASIGEVHVNCISETNSEWEIGWHFLPECWGKGFATEAAAAIIKYAFTYFIKAINFSSVQLLPQVVGLSIFFIN